jgi:hypothetical protein
MTFGPALYGLDPHPRICDCCQLDETATRFINDHISCNECFAQWYDPDNNSFDHLNKRSIGNYVRQKRGLSALKDEP